jgi:ribosomal protein S18 acetylase RimI-like enzyme
MSVVEAESIEQFLEPWKEAMQSKPWFRERRLLDYHPEEIIEGVRQAFHNPNFLFLVAKREDRRKILGVLGVRFTETVATLGRWEPAVTSGHRRSEIGQALLREALLRSREGRISRLRSILKFPYGKPERARWHKELYQKCGFVLERPTMVLLLADLSKTMVRLPRVSHLRFVSGDRFTLEDFADFTERAYMSTSKDKSIHQNDPYVSSRESVLKLLKALRESRMGFSPSKCWQVAKINDRVAGFIFGFIRKESKYDPSNGVLAGIGVFPEFRRIGVGRVLIAELFKVFRKHRCAYSLVGTLKINTPAIKLYRTTRYLPIFEQMDFQRIIRAARD